MQYLAPGLTLIIAHGIIWIIAAFWLTGVHLCPTQIMAPPQVFAILVKWKIHLFRSPTYGLLVGAKCPRPGFNNGPGDNLNSGWILAPSVYSSLIWFIASRQATPILEHGRRLPKRAQSVTKIVKRHHLSCVVHKDLRGVTSTVKKPGSCQ